MRHIHRSSQRRGKDVADVADVVPGARADFDAWRHRRSGAGVLLLAGAKPLAIPLFSDLDLDSLIGALSEPTGEAER